jgi:diaminopimelate decarboxylase
LNKYVCLTDRRGALSRQAGLLVAQPVRDKAGVRTWIDLPPDSAQHLAEVHHTPFYVYDLEVLRERARRAKAALPGAVLYAVKANPHPELVRGLLGLVDGLDVASLGELELAIRCGWAPEQLSFTGPGKTQVELEQAVARGVLLSVESVRELDAVAALARLLGRRTRVRLRLNPGSGTRAWRVAMTGTPSVFGIDEEQLAVAAERVRIHQAWLDFDGVHVHPGSQCTSVPAYAAAAATTLQVVERLFREHGLRAPRVNFGGGLGVLGPGEELDLDAVGKRVAAMLASFGATPDAAVEAVFEPGRWLVAPAGLYVARVISQKHSRGTDFTVLDGGLHHHLGATRALTPPNAPRPRLLNLSRPTAPLVTRTVVGPLCTPLDTLGIDVPLGEPRLGDLIAVLGSGAYGYTFSPLLFLSHRLPTEIVLNGSLTQ